MKVLITGGTGSIGRSLTAHLLNRGYEVTHIGRKGSNSPVRKYDWDPPRGTIDLSAFEGVDAIVHLAGAGIADKRWNKRRKVEILTSRTGTTRLLLHALRTVTDHRIRVLVSASGVSYYGLNDPPGEAFMEQDGPADDFMARVTVAWENEVHVAEELGLRTVMLRTGMALTPRGGALQKLATPVRFFVGAPLGHGRQYANWIHIDDLCNLYIRAIEEPSMSGVYNAVAPRPVTNAELTRAIARALKRPLWLPPVPGFAVRLIAGEVADVVLNGGKVSSEKVQQSGFTFRFPELNAALEDVLKRIP